MEAGLFGVIIRVIGVLIIAKAYIVVVAGISAIVMWNDRNSIVFYGEDNFYDDSDSASETELQNGTVHIFYLFWKYPKRYFQALFSLAKWWRYLVEICRGYFQNMWLQKGP